MIKMDESKFLNKLIDEYPIHRMKESHLAKMIVNPRYIGHWKKKGKSGLLGFSFWYKETLNDEDTSIEGVIIDKFSISTILGIHNDHKGWVNISFERTDPKGEYSASKTAPAADIYEGSFPGGKFKAQSREMMPYDQVEAYDDMFREIYTRSLKQKRKT